VTIEIGGLEHALASKALHIFFERYNNYFELSYIGTHVGLSIPCIQMTSDPGTRVIGVGAKDTNLAFMIFENSANEVELSLQIALETIDRDNMDEAILHVVDALTEHFKSIGYLKPIIIN
jgi:hypothetical protein